MAHLTGHEGAGSLQAWLKSQGQGFAVLLGFGWVLKGDIGFRVQGLGFRV